MLTLEGGVPHKTVLSGTVPEIKGKGSGVTTLGAIAGLGKFGDIRVKLSSPPFMVRQYPFSMARAARLRSRDSCHSANAASLPSRNPRFSPRHWNDKGAVFDLRAFRD